VMETRRPGQANPMTHSRRPMRARRQMPRTTRPRSQHDHLVDDQLSNI
jgi:hypothetical protein